ncbi:hypothetical protein BDZ94DRAFT_982155 [Collybia nuda]|uniref:Uncharacterized protein n=1 Tax=Collybia nuda TaxID=64659 RepID=A0A9P5XZG0_9AGAR|nr:hypothetical protein BDZ94DRAFT_982155 [Collybia nuda]
MYLTLHRMARRALLFGDWSWIIVSSNASPFVQQTSHSIPFFIIGPFHALRPDKNLTSISCYDSALFWSLTRFKPIVELKHR